MKLIKALILITMLSCESEITSENQKVSDKELISEMLSSRFYDFQNAPNPMEQAKVYVRNLSNDAVWMPQNSEPIKGKENVHKFAGWFFTTYQLVIDPEKTIYEEPIIGNELAVQRFQAWGTM